VIDWHKVPIWQWVTLALGLIAIVCMTISLYLVSDMIRIIRELRMALV